MPEFLERLNYSIGNEDWTTERLALKVKPDDTVLCITASGDRPLHLLLDDCKELISVDANPIQNYLLHLKLTAMKALEYEEYVSFLGAKEGNDRKATLQKISTNFNEEACRKFWLDNEKMISKGVLYQGAIEKISKWISRSFRLLRPKKLDRLFQIDNLTEQREFLRKEWDTKFFRNIFKYGLHPTLSKFILKDPGLYSHVGPSLSVGTYIYNRMINCLDNCLAKENLLLSLIFLGRVKEEGFSPYLTYEGSQIIKKRLDKLSIKTDNIIDHMESAPAASVDCFSLSDIASYMNQQDFSRMLKAMLRCAKPGARFCIRQFTSDHQIPEELSPFFKRDLQLEKELEEKDQCFIYRFLAGNIPQMA